MNESDSKRQIHLSIDDIGKSLTWLARYKPDSIFDMRLYGTLLQWHKEYKAKFTLYCFPIDSNILTQEMLLSYVDEFRINSNWLRFGYHGRNEIRFCNDGQYKDDFLNFNRVARQLEMGRTATIRLHYWLANDEQKRFLFQHGIRTLLYPDIESIPYGKDDTFYDGNLEYWKTGVRFETLEVINNDTLQIGKKRVVAFTHERFFDKEKEKMEKAFYLYKMKGYFFI